MIPELAYSPLSPSDSGFLSPAESDALRTPSFPEHPHPLLAYSPDRSCNKHIHAHSDDILVANSSCEFGATKGFGLLPSVYVNNSRVGGSSPPSDIRYECEYLSPIESDALSSPLSPNSPSPFLSSPRHQAQHTFPSYKANNPRTPISEFNLDSSFHSPCFPPGHRLNPHFVRMYELGDELGSGGYGFVVTAKERKEGHEVAVKFIIKEKVPEYAWVDNKRYGRLPIEVVLLSSIDHENIVKCLDIFEDAKYYYLVRFCLHIFRVLVTYHHRDTGARVARYTMAQS